MMKHILIAFFRSFPHHQSVRLFHEHFKVSVLECLLPIFLSCINLIGADDGIYSDFTSFYIIIFLLIAHEFINYLQAKKINT